MGSRLIIEASGVGEQRFAEGARGNLIAQERTTEVKYDVQVGGTIASVGQRLLDTTSKMIIKKFFEKLAEGAVE